MNAHYFLKVLRATNVPSVCRIVHNSCACEYVEQTQRSLQSNEPCHLPISVQFREKKAHFEEMLKEIIEIEGEQMDESANTDLKQIMEEKDHNTKAQYPPRFLQAPTLETAKGSSCQEEPEGNKKAPNHDQMVFISHTTQL